MAWRCFDTERDHMDAAPLAIELNRVIHLHLPGASMPLDSTRSATRAEAIAEAFAALTLGLRPKGAAPIAAVRYARSKMLLSLAEKEADEAKKDAIAAKVIPKGGLTVGAHPSIYADDLVTISANVVEQAAKIDGAGLAADLLQAGVKPALVKRLVAKHTHEFAPAHRYVASLVV
jgi:hypothetical protein